MRAVFFAHAYKGHGRDAGAETTAHDLLKEMVRVGWRVDVILDKEIDHDYYIEGVSVAGKKHKSDFNVAAASANLIISQLDCSERAVYVARTMGIPVVHIVHNTMWQTDAYLGLGCDLAIYNTEWVRDHHERADKEQLIGVASNQQVRYTFRSDYKWPGIVVHPPIDPAEYRTGSPLYRDNYITQVNFFENKSPKDVFWRLAEANPKWKFLAVKGGYGNQHIPGVMQDTGKKYPGDLPDNVMVMDNQSNMREIYGLTQILLVPSQYESFGRVAIEAAASGIPSICSTTPGLMEAMGTDLSQRLAWDHFAEYDNVAQWQYHLRKLMTDDDAYHSAHEKALLRSAHWNDLRKSEIEHFLDCINILVEDGREVLSDYLEG